ncbi:E3 ubiquitin-protein ligase DTX3L-like [Lepisosteus oculatus]|uniref:E3 ubiquitin-protein ligase DTX3L-like n=1 Tax=Lepisosteus oculatus TaxID=7918 RepID=UPI0035F525AA
MATASGEIHGTENGEEPMETDYSPLTEQPAPLPVPTAPLWISVDFLTKERPTKIKIQKMLQSFFNKKIKCEITTMQLVEGTPHYELQISPPFAVPRLLENRFLELEKDKMKVRVHFLESRSQLGAPPQSPTTTPIQEQIPVRVTVQADLTGLGAQAAERLLLLYGKGSPSPREFTMTGSFEEVAKFHRAFCECLPNSQRAPREPEGAESGPARAPLGLLNGDPGPSATDTAEPGVPGSKAPIPVPLLHFDYVSKAYKDEIQKIERENKVAITPNVSVSIDPAGGSEGKATVERAEKEFISLFQDVASHASCVQIPQPSLDHVAEAQREEARLVLSVTAKGCQVIGPARSLAKARMGGGATTSFRSGVESVPELEIKSQDPLVDQGLEIHQTYFHFIRCLFINQVAAIQQKYGVIIRAQDLDDSAMTLKVKVEPGEGRANLQSHALRAFIQLYQKVATKIMGCTLQDPKDTEKAKTVFREICARHPLVIDVEAPGHWKLIGFPEHLSPVVTEIEAKLGGPVFTEGARLRSGPLGSGPSARPEGATGGQDHSTEDQEDTCPICMDSFHSPETLRCKHRFCKECLEKSVEAMGPTCPICKDVFGRVEGNQPDGSMVWNIQPFSLPGYPSFNTIEIHYSIPNGKQTDKHPNPGRLFHGAERTAYLPDSPEGRDVLMLLKKAFDQKLIFTVGTSRTTGAADVVTWNDIHHKTNTGGGPQAFGYPDPDYLKRVKEELKDKGVQ